jgi:TIR domain
VSKIIISYRRLDSMDITMRIRDAMAAHFGESSIFTDIDSIPFGVDFLDYINSVLSTSDALIAIVGPRWIDGGAGPNHGIHLETDFVRIEVEAALKRKIPVIPVLVGGSRMPTRDQLPEPLQPFVFRNGTSIDSGLNFRNDVNRLIRSLEETLPRKQTQEVGKTSKKSRRRTATAGANANTADTVPTQSKVESSLTQDEPHSVQHISNHTPRDSINMFFTHVAIYLRKLRGLLLPNALFILPWLLFCAAITIFLKPDTESLHITILPEEFNADYFAASLSALTAFGVFWLLPYSIWCSVQVNGPAAERDSRWLRVGAIVFIATLVVAFCELQPIALGGMFKSASHQGGIFAQFVDWLWTLAALLAPFSALVAIFRPQIDRLLNEGDKKPTFDVRVSRAAGRVAIYIFGAAIPFLLWMLYLYLSFVGIKDVNISGYHAPLWLSEVSQRWFGDNPPFGTPIAWFYLAPGVELLLAIATPWIFFRKRRKFGSLPRTGEHVNQS